MQIFGEIIFYQSIIILIENPQNLEFYNYKEKWQLDNQNCNAKIVTRSGPCKPILL